MEELLSKYSLEEVCALQWKRCVDKAADDLSQIPADRWIEVAYENFVAEPDAGLKSLTEFLNIKVSDDVVARAVEGVSPRSIGKGRRDLGEKAVKRLMPLIQKTMARFGYA
jgi:hypothetical protein